jgi:hypothetical protein
MYGVFHRLRYGAWREWLGALAVLALLLRALMPTGFMPSPVHGGMQLVLCSLSGTDVSPHERAPHGSDKLPCPFAASGACAAPPAAPAPRLAVTLRLASATVSYRSPALAVPLRHAAARGPPALV